MTISIQHPDSISTDTTITDGYQSDLKPWTLSGNSSVQQFSPNLLTKRSMSKDAKGKIIEYHPEGIPVKKITEQYKVSNDEFPFFLDML